MSADTSTKYRWFILALGIATHILAVGMPYMCMPVLFKEISLDLNLRPGADRRSLGHYQPAHRILCFFLRDDSR